MRNKFIFLRHAETKKDPAVHATEWGLSSDGEVQARELVENPLLQSVDIVYVSEERKTYLTVAPLLAKIQKDYVVDGAFNEVLRGDGFFTKEEFENEKTKQLLDFTYSAFGGESGVDALKRFIVGIENIEKTHDGKTVLVVTHGTILNMYFAELLGAHSSIVKRWEDTGFGAIGIVEDEVVVKDII